MQSAGTAITKPVRRRSSAKHRAILEASADLVARRGYHSVTVEQVAAEAGVGKQTIYRWWPSKPALFLEVYEDLVPDAGLDGADGPPDERLAVFLEGVFAVYATTPAARILCGLVGDAQKDTETHVILRDGLVAGRGRRLVEFFERARLAGELPADFDDQWAADTVVAMIWRHLLCEARMPDARFAHRLSAWVTGTGRAGENTS